MLRAALLCLAIVGAAWLEFKVFPGHSYLEGDTQLYVPMLERLDSPGLLARDLVATNPSLALTAYDEVTLLLHRTGRQSFRRALLGQQLILRILALVGVFLLARAAGLGYMPAFVIACLVNLGAAVAGPAVSVLEREPIPGAFAFPLVLLAMGLVVWEMPLLAAVAGGLAFLYDPILALPFWIVLLVGCCCSRNIRRLGRPMLSVLLVFVLLLGNLAQLQPASGGETVFGHISTQLKTFQQLHTPYLYVSAWPSGEVYQLLALAILALSAATRLWPLLPHTFRWLIMGTGACGCLAIPISYLLIDQQQFAWAARLQPARTLLYTAAASALLFGLAGMRAMSRRQLFEAFGWFFLLCLLPAGVGAFDVFKITNGQLLSQSAAILVLGACLTGLLFWATRSSAKILMLAAPVLAVVLLAYMPGLRPARIPTRPSTSDLAAWAGRSTWGSAVFLFPDAGIANFPGIFRAESLHALWADWKTAQGVAYSETASQRWQERWRQTMQNGFSPAQLESLLPLPIDYYVLQRQNQLASPRYAFRNRDFVVYDAEDLRNAPKPLR